MPATITNLLNKVKPGGSKTPTPAPARPASPTSQNQTHSEGVIPLATLQPDHAGEALEFLAECEPYEVLVLMIPGLLRQRADRLKALRQELTALKTRLAELYRRRNDILGHSQSQSQEQPPEQTQPEQEGAAA